MISPSRQRIHRRAALPLFLLLVAAALPITFGCGRTAAGSSTVEVGLQLLSEKAVGPASVEVTLRTPEGKPVEGAQVSVRGDMSHAGMTPVLAQSKPSGDGRYVTEGFRFTMGGDWILTALVTLPNGEKAERSFNVNGVIGR